MLKGISQLGRNHAWNIKHMARRASRASIRKSHLLMKAESIERQRKQIAKQIAKQMEKNKPHYLVWWRRVILFIKNIFTKQNVIA